MSHSADGWGRTRMERGYKSVKFRAVCDLCPWMSSNLWESPNTADHEMDEHCETLDHKDKLAEAERGPLGVRPDQGT